MFCAKIGYLTLGDWMVIGSQITFSIHYRPEGADKELARGRVAGLGGGVSILMERNTI